jgi:3-hydroxyisobutyrate dehydrogenase-like beta-hydroxyacid dehydrogenase
MQADGIRFVDGGIIGGPAWEPGETWLYLSGEFAVEAATCFSKGPLETKILGTQIGKASALKMCYAAYSKGTAALLAAILAAASALGVQEDLFTHWDMDEEDFSTKVRGRVARSTAKAWRFEGEMREIAATLQDAGLPGGFHNAAAEVFQRMAGFKDKPNSPSLDEVLQALRGQ